MPVICFHITRESTVYTSANIHRCKGKTKINMSSLLTDRYLKRDHPPASSETPLPDHRRLRGSERHVLLLRPPHVQADHQPEHCPGDQLRHDGCFKWEDTGRAEDAVEEGHGASAQGPRGTYR